MLVYGQITGFFLIAVLYFWDQRQNLWSPFVDSLSGDTIFMLQVIFNWLWSSVFHHYEVSHDVWFSDIF